jgi:tetratricopeptide (TPR) repeat protein
MFVAANEAQAQAQLPSTSGSPAWFGDINTQRGGAEVVEALKKGIAECAQKTKLNPSDATIFFNCAAAIHNMSTGLAVDPEWFNTAIAYITAAINLTDPKSNLVAQYYIIRGDFWFFHRFDLSGIGAIFKPAVPSDIAHAIDDYTAAIAIQPYNGQSLSLKLPNKGSEEWRPGGPYNAYAKRAEAYETHRGLFDHRELDSDSRPIPLPKASVDGQMSDLGNEIADYTGAMRVEPQATTYYLKRGDAYLTRAKLFQDEKDIPHAIGDYQAAIADYTRYTHADPNPGTTKQAEAQDRLDDLYVPPAELASRCNKCVSACEEQLKPPPFNCPSLSAALSSNNHGPIPCFALYKSCVGGDNVSPDPDCTIAGRSAAAVCSSVVAGFSGYVGADLKH